jgi:3-dehydroquinate dehydratase/shikimate dehydrogenase
VTLVAQDVEHMLAQAARAKDAGAAMVEYRLDALAPEALDVARLLASTPLAAIATFRLPADGGRREIAESDRIDLLKDALFAGAAYVDIEHGREDSIAAAASGRLIVSHHDMKATPPDAAGIARAIEAGPADVVKIATLATHAKDTFVHYEILTAATKPTVAFAMGGPGSSSRVLSLRFGAAWTYAALDDDACPAPGQISVERMIRDYRALEAKRGVPFFGVIGHPIGHSMSPPMHNASLNAVGAEGVYVSFDVESDVVSFVRAAFALGCRGLSVTIPHKLEVMNALDEIEPAAKRIGAVNTVYLKDGKLVGTNSDLYGATSAIAKAAGGLDSLNGASALVIGAGGAARAIVFGLTDAGARVSVTDIFEDKARELASAAGAECAAHADVDVSRYDVIANASPVGMHPKVDATPVDGAKLRAPQIVFDAVYNPRETRLLREARAAGCRVAEGIEMFVGQGAKQFELFTGRAAPLETMKEVVLARLR